MIGVQGLMPPGPAFHAVNVEGTTQYQYWRALANVLAYTYGRLCAYVDEFFCATVSESRDQWLEEYGLPNACDPYGNNLCAKVAADGGATCEAFVEAAAASGWVISCSDDYREPIAGCFEVGCTPLGPTPTYNPAGSAIGIGEVNACNYGEVVNHPDRGKWEHGKTANAACPVPGSNLGQGPDTDESCCFIVGWYEPYVDPVSLRTDFCQPGNSILFDCPANDIYPLYVPTPHESRYGAYDSTGNYTEWGQAFCWEVSVDLAASWALQRSNAALAQNAENQKLIQLGQTPPPPYTSSEAGNLMAGSIIPTVVDSRYGGTPLCIGDVGSYSPAYMLCLLDAIKPAHTTLTLKVIQP